MPDKTYPTHTAVGEWNGLLHSPLDRSLVFFEVLRHLEQLGQLVH